MSWLQDIFHHQTVLEIIQGATNSNTNGGSQVLLDNNTTPFITNNPPNTSTTNPSFLTSLGNSFLNILNSVPNAVNNGLTVQTENNVTPKSIIYLIIGFVAILFIYKKMMKK